MAYCSDRRVTYRPSELDFAYLDDIGYEILDAATASEPELYGFGAWARYSVWGVGVERTIQYHGNHPLRGRGNRQHVGYAAGGRGRVSVWPRMQAWPMPTRPCRGVSPGRAPSSAST